MRREDEMPPRYHPQSKHQMHRQEHSAHLQISGITLSGRIHPHRAAVGVPKERRALAGSRRKHRMPAGSRTAHVAWYQKTVSRQVAQNSSNIDRERAGRVIAGNLDMAYFFPRSQPCQGVSCKNMRRRRKGHPRCRHNLAAV
jgi:hypothetical protein